MHFFRDKRRVCKLTIHRSFSRTKTNKRSIDEIINISFINGQLPTLWINSTVRKSIKIFLLTVGQLRNVKKKSEQNSSYSVSDAIKWRCIREFLIYITLMVSECFTSHFLESNLWIWIFSCKLQGDWPQHIQYPSWWCPPRNICHRVHEFATDHPSRPIQS